MVFDFRRTLRRNTFVGEKIYFCGIRRLTYLNRRVEPVLKKYFGFAYQEVRAKKVFNLFLQDIGRRRQLWEE